PPPPEPAPLGQVDVLGGRYRGPHTVLAPRVRRPARGAGEGYGQVPGEGGGLAIPAVGEDRLRVRGPLDRRQTQGRQVVPLLPPPLLHRRRGVRLDRAQVAQGGQDRGSRQGG